MQSTKPSANFHPHMLQYTPKNASIESRVLSLVSPSSRNLALVIAKTMATLNFHSISPAGPNAPIHFFHTPAGCSAVGAGGTAGGSCDSSPEILASMLLY